MNTETSHANAEDALKTTADSVGALATKIQETVRQTQDRLTELQHELVDKTKYAAESTDMFVHEKPWNAVCAAVAVGFVLGVLIGRR